MDPEEALKEGVAILSHVLEPRGFRFVAGASGHGSGGQFASGAFIRGDRTLELHFRHSLGLVAYKVGPTTLSHEEFMYAVQRGRGTSRYPGFSDDPLQGFRDLGEDLQSHGQAFLSSSLDEFQECVDWAVANPRPEGFHRISRGGAA